MQNYRREWTELDFDSLSWHDNEVHGIHFRNPRKEERFDLVLDIDYIVHWNKTGNGTFTFLVAPALLAFHQVTKLECRLALLYKEHLTIDRIERQKLTVLSGISDPISGYHWSVYLQPDASPRGIIAFEATGFTQRLTKEPIEVFTQSLDDDQR